MPELRIFYVLPAETWEVKAAPASEPVAVFRTPEEARNYLETLDRIARRHDPEGSDPPPQDSLW